MDKSIKTNYSAIYLIELQVLMSSNEFKKSRIELYWTEIREYMQADPPVDFEIIRENLYNRVYRDIITRSEYMSGFAMSWFTKCLQYLMTF